MTFIEINEGLAAVLWSEVGSPVSMGFKSVTTKHQPLELVLRKQHFIIQDLVQNTSLGAGLLVVRNKIPSGIHLLGSSEGGISSGFSLFASLLEI